MGPSLISMFNECLTQEYSLDWADEVWTINMASMLVRHDLVIWMDDLVDQERFKPGLFTALRKWKSPVLTTKSNRAVIPNSYDYPIDEIVTMSLPVFGKPYFNNGVAMAIAYAMYKGVKKLKLYGCDFTYPNRNYAEGGRGCTEAWLALASASGMELVMPEKTSLFDAVEPDKGIYGYAKQPTIKLPDGRFYNPVDGSITETKKPKDVKADVNADSESGYKPEDTRNEDAVSRPVSGANGSAAPNARARHNKAKPVAEVATPAVN
jgi:hypothetical protein